MEEQNDGLHEPAEVLRACYEGLGRGDFGYGVSGAGLRARCHGMLHALHLWGLGEVEVGLLVSGNANRIM